VRSKVEIENVAKEFSCWQRYGRNLSEKSSSAEEPEAASVGWGAGVDRTAMSASHGVDLGWQWFKDPRLDSLGFRGIFPSDITREFSKFLLVMRSVYVYSITKFSEAYGYIMDHLIDPLTEKLQISFPFYGCCSTFG
jgi:hypothetical protein